MAMSTATKWAIGIGVAAVGVLAFTQLAPTASAAVTPKLPGKIIKMSADTTPTYDKNAGTWYVGLHITYDTLQTATQIVPILQNNGSAPPTDAQTKAALDNMMTALLQLGSTGKGPMVAAVSPVAVVNNEVQGPDNTPGASPGVRTLPDGRMYAIFSLVLDSGVQLPFGVIVQPTMTDAASLALIGATTKKQLMGLSAYDAEKWLMSAPDVILD